MTSEEMCFEVSFECFKGWRCLTGRGREFQIVEAATRKSLDPILVLTRGLVRSYSPCECKTEKAYESSFLTLGLNKLN